MFTMNNMVLIFLLGSILIKGIISEIDIEHKNATGCLWIKGTDGVQMQTVVNLSCTTGSVHVVEGSFIRPYARSDKACFDKDQVIECCSALPQRICDVSLDLSKMNIECEGYQNCSFVVETINLDNDCHHNCNTGHHNNNQWCWPRLLQIKYICIMNTGDTSTDKQIGGSLESVAQCTGGNSCTAPVTVLAILLPIAFLGGGVLVHLLYTRCNFMMKWGTKEKPSFSGLKGLQNPTAEQDNTLGATSSNEDPVVPYRKMEKDSRVSDADHEYVILADDKVPTQNGSWASGKEKQPEMSENPYYDGDEDNNNPKASGYQNVLDNGVEMTENAYYDGTDDLKKTSVALPNTLGHDVTDGEIEMTDNTYYNGTDSGPGIKDSHDGQKNEGEKNYVYTYGHFKLEGRQREEH